MTRLVRIIAFSLLVLALPGYAHAQTAIYHLHKESSTTSGLLQLTTAGPDAPSTAFTSISLKSKQPGEFVIKEFDTQSGVPGVSGVIPSGSTLSFTLYMRKTTAFGNMAPKAKVYLNNATGPLLCTATAAFALSTTVTPFTLTCTTSSAVTMAASDRLYLWTGIQLTAKPGNNDVQAELDIEGTPDGPTDSKIVVPLPGPPGPPTITSLSPSSGAVGTSVTIGGSSFGSTRGTSTVTFNGTSATPTSWSNTSIVVPVPAGATTGPVVVTVGGVASNGVPFTVVTPPSISSLSPPRGFRGAVVTVNGSNFGSVQGTSTVTFNGVAGIPSSWSDTAVMVPVPSSATTGPVIVTVGGLASNGVVFTVFGTGAITGTVTRTLDATPVSGAIVEVLESGVVKASTITASQGGYSLSSLLSGTYDLRVTAAGFTQGLRTGLSINDGTNTPVDWSLAAASSALTALYHLHREASSTSGLNQLKADDPDAPATSLYSIQLKSKGTGEYLVQAFDTPAGTPNLAGTIPAGSTVSVTLAMRQTTSFGTMTPRAKLFLNSTSGPPLCTATSSSALTTTLNKFTFTCTTTANVSMNTSDRFYLWAGINLTVKPGNNSVQAELDVEGAANGTTDSHVTVPLPSGSPALSNLSATSGRVGTSITIRGVNFGPSQGSSTVTFNGMAATPSSWTGTAVTAPVPTGATTGPVMVMVGGVASNRLIFYVDDLAPGVIATVAGTGTSGFAGDSGPAVSAQLNNPRGVAMDSQMALFIADWYNNRIRKVDPGGVITTVAGCCDVPACCLEGVPAVQAPLSRPTGVAPDRLGNFFIGESGRMWKVDTSGIIWAAAGGGPHLAADLQGNIFSTGRSEVLKLDTAGVVTQVATGLNNASGVAVDSRGNLFIADTGSHRIRKITLDGVISTVAGTGTAGFSGDFGPATAAQLNSPYGVAVDENGALFIADTVNARIRKVSPGGIITTVAGTGVRGYGGDGAAATNAVLDFPTGIAVIGEEVLFIGDTGNHRVRKVGGGPFPDTPVIMTLSSLIGPVGTSITISGSTFGAVQGNSVVTFNGVLSTVSLWSDTEITATVPPGATTGLVIVTVAGRASNGVHFTVPSIEITYPTPGAILNQLETVVRGRFAPGLGEVFVAVNGRPAMVSGQDFAINAVVLSVGTTEITATLKTVDGIETQHSVSVTTTAQDAYVRVTAPRDQALAPMSAVLTVDGVVPAPVTEAALEISGPSPGYVNTPQFPFTATMDLVAPGMYLITATVTTTSGSYVGQMAINVLDRVSTEALFLGKWDGVKAAVAAGDIEGALAYFLPSSRERYRMVFQDLGTTLPSKLESIEAINLLSVGEQVTEAEAIRTESGTPFSYPVTYRRDANGFWKFDGF